MWWPNSSFEDFSILFWRRYWRILTSSWVVSVVYVIVEFFLWIYKSKQYWDFSWPIQSPHDLNTPIKINLYAFEPSPMAMKNLNPTRKFKGALCLWPPVEGGQLWRWSSMKRAIQPLPKFTPLLQQRNNGLCWVWYSLFPAGTVHTLQLHVATGRVTPVCQKVYWHHNCPLGT